MDDHSELTERTYVLGEDILHQRVGSDMVLINLKNDRIFSLNLTGARFFELLENKLSLTDIKEKLSEEFDVNPDMLELEIQDIINKLLDEKMITDETL